ncbi:MAG: hypothetical protein RLZZ455_430 [Candidatus Parcubacteria bacterium]|jgi:uncharacterized membrane protein
MDYIQIIDGIGIVIDALGVLVIAFGVVLSISLYLSGYLQKEHGMELYKKLRMNLAKTILLGLEFLVAGDIIRSIATPPTLTTVFVLAVIVLIRSFLSVQFEKETEGHFPWERHARTS